MLPGMDTTNTKTPCRRITQDELPGLLAEFDDSGLSVAAFARVRRLRASPLYRAIGKRETGASPPPVSFAPIRVASALSPSGTFTIELPSGDRLTVPSDFDDR
jgi:hypothetical protein